MRFVAGLGVAHFLCDLTAERVQHVKRLAAALPEDAADAVLVHESRHMRHDNVPIWGQGAVVARIPRLPKGRARPLELRFFVLAQQLVCAAARDPPRAARCTKSAASTSPCIALIFSLMFANMAV